VNRRILVTIIIILVVITVLGVTFFYHIGTNEHELNLKRNAIKAYIKNNCIVITNVAGDKSVVCK
jgi:flagellar basal body-associated protein FliL